MELSIIKETIYLRSIIWIEIINIFYGVIAEIHYYWKITIYTQIKNKDIIVIIIILLLFYVIIILYVKPLKKLSTVSNIFLL
jgi:hypothetical protein